MHRKERGPVTDWAGEPAEQGVSATRFHLAQGTETPARCIAGPARLQRRPRHSPFCECAHPDWDSSERLTRQRTLVHVTKPVSHDPLKLQFTLPKNEKLRFHIVRELKQAIGQWGGWGGGETEQNSTKVTVVSVGKGVEDLRPSSRRWRGCKTVWLLWKMIWWYFPKSDAELPRDPAIPLLGR